MTTGKIQNSAYFDENLGRFLKDMRQYSILDAVTERKLAEDWKYKRCPRACELLVGSHLRLVVKTAKGFRGYGLPLSDLVAEGNVGLMQALERFEPERGFRLSTYALWWIRATIQEYVLKSWSLVKIATTSNQKKLFFNLRRLKVRLQAIEEDSLTPDQIAEIATELCVTENDVTLMDQRLFGRDQSLNIPVSAEDDAEWIDWLEDDRDTVEQEAVTQDLYKYRQDLMFRGMALLDKREQHILASRLLQEDPPTLEALSEVHGISRERVRQIESKALSKLKKIVRAMPQAREAYARVAA